MLVHARIRAYAYIARATQCQMGESSRVHRLFCLFRFFSKISYIVEINKFSSNYLINATTSQRCLHIPFVRPPVQSLLRESRTD